MPTLSSIPYDNRDLVLVIWNLELGRRGWDDELVIEAVSEHYGLDKAMMTPPRKEAPAKQSEAKQQLAEECMVLVAEGKKAPRRKRSKTSKAK